MLFRHSKKDKRSLLRLLLSSIIVVVLTLVLMSAISNPQEPRDSSAHTETFDKKTGAMADSTIRELTYRLSKVESYLQTPLSDNFIHPGNVMEMASLIISAITVIMIFVNIFIAIHTRSTVKDWKEEYRSDIEDFKYAAALTTEKLKETEDVANRLRKELKVLAGQATDIPKVMEQEIEALLRSHGNKMTYIINSVTEKIAEIFSDRATLKRFEVIRSKAFFQLGDEREKIRSLQYISFLGSSEDLVFLDKVAADPEQTAEVRLAAQKAKTMIQARRA